MTPYWTHTENTPESHLFVGKYDQTILVSLRPHNEAIVQFQGLYHADTITMSLKDAIKFLNTNAVEQAVRPECLVDKKKLKKIYQDEDGKFWRKRRGEWVEIPPEWVGKVTYKQTIMKRPSKEGGKRYRKHNQ